MILKLSKTEELMIWKTQKKIWKEVTTRKTTKSEEKKLYEELIQKDIDTLKREKSNRPEKYNISDTLNNVGSIFTGAYKDALQRCA